MRITARQLRAIEKTIGFDASVIMITDRPSRSWMHEVVFRVEAIVEGHKYYTEMHIHENEGVPFSYVASTLVNMIQRSIQDHFFSKAFDKGE